MVVSELHRSRRRFGIPLFIGWLLMLVAHQFSVQSVWADGVFILLAAVMCIVTAVRRDMPRPRWNVGLWLGTAIVLSYLLRAAIQHDVPDTTLLLRYTTCWLLFLFWLSALRRKQTLELIGAALLTVCVIEVLIGAGQLIGTLHNSNDRFTLGGTIGTPSAYGSYLGVMAPVLLALVLQQMPFSSHTRIPVHIQLTVSIALLLLLLTLLALSLSRSGWIAAVMGCGLVVERRYRLLRRLRHSLRRRLFRVMAIGVFALAASAAVVTLYQFKSASVDGRVLIWKVALRSPEHYRLWGGGTGYFAAHYNRWQADYFADDGGTPRERWLGDYVGGAYNVFIDILMDDGIAVLICFVLLLAGAFLQPTSHHPLLFFALKASLAGMVVVLSVSFLFPLLYLWMLFCLAALYAGGGGGHEEAVHHTHPIRRWVLSAVFLVVSLCSLRLTYGTYLWTSAIRAAERSDTPRSLTLFRKADPILGSRAAFNISYAQAFLTRGFYPEAIARLERSLRQKAMPTTCLALATCYREEGELAKAAETYTLLANMIPHKLQPRYLLAQVLFEMKAYDRAKAIALDVAKAPQKVETAKGEQIRMEAVMLVNKINKAMQGERDER